MTDQQRQQLLSQGTRYIILDEKKQRYNLDSKGNRKIPNTPYYVLDLEKMSINEIDKSIIKK